MQTEHTQVVKAITDLICCYQHSWNPHRRPQDTYKKEMRIQSIEFQNTFFLSLRNWMWSNRFNLLLSNPKQNVQLASAKTTRVLGNKCDVSFCLWINRNPFMCNKLCMKSSNVDCLQVQRKREKHETSNDDDAVLKEVKIREEGCKLLTSLWSEQGSCLLALQGMIIPWCILLSLLQLRQEILKVFTSIWSDEDALFLHFENSWFLHWPTSNSPASVTAITQEIL